ncbi:MAG: hypothetical protein HUJ31_07585 [Pseudomonadales bacterium]|nr:hypothetical protein [Pseudomonadales bacterium]
MMDSKDRHMFDDWQNVKRVLHILYAVCALLFVLDFILHRHATHPWDGVWGFYPIYGFVACVLLVIVAKWMRKIVMRSQDYYDEEDLKGVEGDRDVDV